MLKNPYVITVTDGYILHRWLHCSSHASCGSRGVCL